jgi:hypothetical protein
VVAAIFVFLIQAQDEVRQAKVFPIRVIEKNQDE